jgi:hypothetical protein
MRPLQQTDQIVSTSPGSFWLHGTPTFITSVKLEVENYNSAFFFLNILWLGFFFYFSD